MNTERIDFISSYCDRWCERCAYTARCSSYAVQIATAMCDGDVAQAIELAVGEPHPVPGDSPPPERPWLDAINEPMTPEEHAEFERQEAARDARLQGASITRIAHAYGMLAHRWLAHAADGMPAAGDPVLVEALQVVSHDSVLIGAKLYRALSGRDRHRHDGDDDDHPVQNDWNGSAKVALISLERSESAWRSLAHATADPIMAMLADAARDLRRLVTEEFPRAVDFVRPGFDEPGR